MKKKINLSKIIKVDINKTKKLKKKQINKKKSKSNVKIKQD